MTDTTKIIAGEAEFSLADDFNAWCDLEIAFDRTSINGVIKKLGDPENLRLLDVRTFMRAMLRADGKPLAPEAADAVCQVLGVEAATRAVANHIMTQLVRN